MKPPTSRINFFNRALIELSVDVNEFGMSIEDAIEKSIHSIFSSANTIQEVLVEKYSIPFLKYLVRESMPFRDSEGRSGWFVVKAISKPAIMEQKDSHSWVFFGLGYIETKKFFGLFNKSEWVICNLNNGDYRVYPKELLEYAINISEGIKEVGNELITRLIEKESVEAEEKLKIRRMREKKMEDNLLEAFNKQPILDFNSTSIDDATAGILTKYKGHLKLNAISSLSYSVAKLLARQEGALELNGLVDISDQVAESLAEHDGPLYARASVLEKINKYKE